MSCFYPDGSIAEGLTPCNTTAGAVSGCCRVGDVCLTNGFCFSAGQNSVIRRGCTDRTFNSTQCPTKCIAGEVASVDVVMTPCGDYTYFCCGQDDAARNCCTSGNGTVHLAAGTAILPTATVTYTNTITPTASIASGSSSSTNETPNCKSTKNMVSVGAVGGLAGALGLAMISAIILWIMLGRKNKQLRIANDRVIASVPYREGDPRPK